MNLPKIQLPNIFIVGPSGSGKSTSFRNLDPERTAIFNINRKALPFRNAGKFKHHEIIQDYGDLVLKIMQVGMNPAIDVVAIDDFTSADESILKNCRATEKGFTIYGKHNQEVASLINATLALSEPKLKGSEIIPAKWVIWTGIDEIINIPQPDGTNKAAKRIKVEGRELAGWIETKFTVVLFTEVIANKDPGQSGFKYKFATNGDGVTSAKTPMELFKERLVDNDIAMVIKELKKYYELPT